MDRLILLTNDDGIASSGLDALAQSLSALGEVVVSAPDREQSAVGHGISLSRPLRARRVAPGRFAVSGTPVDCVLLAFYELCPRPPDLVVSGINLGANLGTDVFYSGTVAGALEGAMHGAPAIAVSQELPRARGDGAAGLGELLERTGRFAAAVGAKLLDEPPPTGITLSINAPTVLTDRFVWTRLGRRVYGGQVEKRLDPRGRAYYWIGGPPLPGNSGPGTDAHAVESGLISITPLGLDLTASLSDDWTSWQPRLPVGEPRPAQVADELEEEGEKEAS